MTKKIDMSAEAVTNRMVALDQLWELAVALKSSEIVKEHQQKQPDFETVPPKIQNERA